MSVERFRKLEVESTLHLSAAAETSFPFRPLPRRTVEQSQACSTSRTFMAAPLSNKLQVP